MREIKFRAWNKDQKRMMYELEVLFANKLEDIFEQLDDFEFPYMQYTGFKDEYGKEIYEGDIVKCTDGEGGVSELNSDTGIGRVEWLEKFGFWNISNIENGLGDIIFNGFVEVIGNIYEDGHLLEK